MVISRVTHGSYIWKPGQVIDDLVVPADLALIDEDRERGDGERLAGRAGRENRVGIDRLGRAELAHAEAFGERDLVVLDDRDRHAGHADLFAQAFRAGSKSAGGAAIDNGAVCKRGEEYEAPRSRSRACARSHENFIHSLRHSSTKAIVTPRRPASGRQPVFRDVRFLPPATAPPHPFRDARC